MHAVQVEARTVTASVATGLSIAHLILLCLPKSSISAWSRVCSGYRVKRFFAMRDRKLPKGLPRAELARRTGANLEPCATTRRSACCRRDREPPAAIGAMAGHMNAALALYRGARALEEIRALLRLVDERGQPCAEASRLATTHLADVRAKIADLKRMEGVLKTVFAQCVDATRLDCPLIETLFRETTF